MATSAAGTRGRRSANRSPVSVPRRSAAATASMLPTTRAKAVPRGSAGRRRRAMSRCAVRRNVRRECAHAMGVLFARRAPCTHTHADAPHCRWRVYGMLRSQGDMLDNRRQRIVLQSRHVLHRARCRFPRRRPRSSPARGGFIGTLLGRRGFDVAASMTPHRVGRVVGATAQHAPCLSHPSCCAPRRIHRQADEANGLR